MKNIAVAVGMSDYSQNVIAFADNLAQKKEAKLHLLHVTPEPMLASVASGGFSVPAVTAEDMGKIENRFKEYVDELSLRAPFELHHEVGIPQHEIVRFLSRQPVDLLVMGSHDHSLVERLFLGSTSNYVLHHAKTPVYLHRPEAGKMENDILLPVDIHDVHPEVIKAADRWATTYGSKLTFLYVDSFMPYYQSWAPEIYSDIPMITSETPVPVHEDFQGELREVVQNAGVTHEYRIEIAKGKTGPTILEVQEKLKNNWIFMAAHSYKNLERFLLGSTTDYLVNHAPCSLYIVK